MPAKTERIKMCFKQKGIYSINTKAKRQQKRLKISTKQRHPRRYPRTVRVLKYQEPQGKQTLGNPGALTKNAKYWN